MLPMTMEYKALGKISYHELLQFVVKLDASLEANPREYTVKITPFETDEMSEMRDSIDGYIEKNGIAAIMTGLRISKRNSFSDAIMDPMISNKYAI